MRRHLSHLRDEQSWRRRGGRSQHRSSSDSTNRQLRWHRWLRRPWLLLSLLLQPGRRQSRDDRRCNTGRRRCGDSVCCRRRRWNSTIRRRKCNSWHCCGGRRRHSCFRRRRGGRDRRTAACGATYEAPLELLHSECLHLSRKRNIRSISRRCRGRRPPRQGGSGVADASPRRRGIRAFSSSSSATCVCRGSGGGGGGWSIVGPL
mmetsp:Transcript_43398/g.132022  ORF Transcript_43398/g.132022 Transcript_43398/m.132022 type:complete len:204 (-) Transcript_43398:259-870(-)